MPIPNLSGLDIHEPVVHRTTLTTHRVRAKEGDLIILLCGPKRRFTQFTYDLSKGRKNCKICYVTSIHSPTRLS